MWILIFGILTLKNGFNKILTKNFQHSKFSESFDKCVTWCKDHKSLTI